jgi:4-amino-4-deoxy-L-arabinose transferase-like glycosyltransferase
MPSPDVARDHEVRRRRRALGAVLVVAFGLRLAWALALHVDVRASFRLDMSVYDLLARRLAAGEGYARYLGEPMAFFPPGYPAILAVLYTVFGQSLVTAWVANAAFGALTCLFLHATATRLFGPAVGLGAAAILAVFPGDVFSSAYTLSEAGFGCLFVAVLCLFVRWNAPDAGTPSSRWLLFGIVLGAAALVRGVALPFLVVPALVWLAALGLRVALVRTALATLGLALVVFPWTLRNQVVMGAPILLSTDGPFALFVAHNPVASGTQSVDMNEQRKREWPWLETLPYPQREVTQARLELRYGLRYLLTHPRHELTLIPKRIYYLYEHDHHALIPATPPRRLRLGGEPVGPNLDTLMAAVADLYYFAVVLFALVGLPRAARAADVSAWVLLLSIAYYTLLHGVLFFGDARYHAPLVPVFCVLAALGAQTMFGVLRAAPGPTAPPPRPPSSRPAGRTSSPTY